MSTFSTIGSSPPRHDALAKVSGAARYPGDLAMPGFANMVQGELHAPPMITSTHQGVCAAGMAALQHAASTLELHQGGPVGV